MLPTAGDLTTSELRDITGHAVITVDPDGAEERHQVAAARRELALQALPDAMASLKAYLPADGAVKIFQVSDLLATGTAGTPGDTRGIGARRVDALIDIADQLLTNGYLDLTDYLGRELPDHTTPPARTRTTDPAHRPPTAPADRTPTPTRRRTARPATSPQQPTTAGTPATRDRPTAATDHSRRRRRRRSPPTARHRPRRRRRRPTDDRTDDTQSADTDRRRRRDDATDDRQRSQPTTADGVDVEAATLDDAGRRPTQPRPDGSDDADVRRSGGRRTEAEPTRHVVAGDGRGRRRGVRRCRRSDQAEADAEAATPVTTGSPRRRRHQPARSRPRPANPASRPSPGSPAPGCSPGKAAARTCRSPSACPPSPDWTTCPAPSPGSAPSPPPWPAASPHPPAPSPPYSPTPTPAPSPPPEPSPTDPPKTSATRSPPSSTPASSRPAGNPSGAANTTTGTRSTTSTPNRAEKPTRKTSIPTVNVTTFSNTIHEWQVRPDPDRTVLQFTSPTGHHYSKHGRQASPPQLWVDTVGADTAEHLDNIINPPTTLVDPRTQTRQRHRRTPHHHPHPARPDHPTDRIPARRNCLANINCGARKRRSG